MVRIAWAATVVLLETGSLVGQCSNSWLPGEAAVGLSNRVWASTEWDPDGAGPTPAQIVVAGEFLEASGAPVSRIARWDAAAGTWVAIGAGFAVPPTSRVSSLAVLPDGSLVAAGFFQTSGTNTLSNIAVFDGTSWISLGGGVSSSVVALAVLPNGDLVAGGTFTLASGVVANRIARWDGTTWSAFGSGANAEVLCLAVLPNGDLVAGGSFTSIGGIAAAHIARWNGTSWSALGPGLTPDVTALAVRSNGNIVATGRQLAEWDGVSWSQLGGGIGTNQGWALAILPNDDVLVGGAIFMTIGGVVHTSVVRWDGHAWSGLTPDLAGTVLTLRQLSNGGLLAAGELSSLGGICIWDGATWSPLGGGLDDPVNALKVLTDGSVIVGGDFSSAGGLFAKAVARWDGVNWSTLGGGVDGLVTSLEQMPDGNLAIGGRFVGAGGDFSLTYLAGWNGSAWFWLGPGINSVNALAAASDGTLYAGGEFIASIGYNHIARRTGSTWTPLASGVNGSVRALAIMPNGDLVAGGSFSSASGVSASRIARWNGASWSPLGSGVDGDVTALAVMPNGDLLVGGAFATAGGVAANGIARWDGTSWSSLGAGIFHPTAPIVRAIAVLPNGDVVVGGLFTTAGGVAANNIARWDGASWSSFGSGADDLVRALGVLPGGDVVVGGRFRKVDGRPSAYFARLTTSCPATVAIGGVGCIGGAGNLQLRASLPWIGATYTSEASGFAPGTIAVWAAGFPQSVPLSLVHPAAAPGCTLWTTLDVEFGIEPVVGGRSVHSVTIPDNAALVGLTFSKQAAELTFQGSEIGLLATTNSVLLTVGVF